MKDELNAGLASDRFQVEWWVNSNRVNRRLSRRVRQKLDLAHYLSADVEIINPTVITKRDLPVPPEVGSLPRYLLDEGNTLKPQLILLEIPSDINKMKELDMDLAIVWRQHSREYLMALFESGYFVSDFVYLPGAAPRSFYILVHGESTL
jgi:predicted GNAT superfamily acetyltransferase